MFDLNPAFYDGDKSGEFDTSFFDEHVMVCDYSLQNYSYQSISGPEILLEPFWHAVYFTFV